MKQVCVSAPRPRVALSLSRSKRGDVFVLYLLHALTARLAAPRPRTDATSERHEALIERGL